MWIVYYIIVFVINNTRFEIRLGCRRTQAVSFAQRRNRSRTLLKPFRNNIRTQRSALVKIVLELYVESSFKTITILL